MSKIIVHIDLNAFFVRCEEIKDPSIINKAVIIGHKGRGGIVSTCSYAARKKGIRSGMPTFQAISLCPNVLIIPGDYKYYSMMSNKFVLFIKQHCKKVEQASIDECYLDMTDELSNIPNKKEYLLDIQKQLFAVTGLKCSIGVGPTKFLAKMASDLKKPMGFVVINRSNVREILDPLPIEDFYGIGKKTAPRLKEKGIITIGDLAKKINSDDPLVKEEFGKFYYVIKEWINGYGSDEVISEAFDPKSIGNSHTLPFDTNNFNDLKECIIKLSNDVSQRAKEQHKIGNTVQIVLKDSYFKNINRSITFKKYTNDCSSIKNYAVSLLEKNFDEKKMIRLVGVTLQNLIEEGEALQKISIFDNFEQVKEENKTRLLIQELNNKMKKDIFKTVNDLTKDNKNGNK